MNFFVKDQRWWEGQKGEKDDSGESKDKVQWETGGRGMERESGGETELYKTEMTDGKSRQQLGTVENEKGERDGDQRWRGKETKKAGPPTPPGPSRELARKNLKPEGHPIQNQELNLIVSRPCPSPSDE